MNYKDSLIEDLDQRTEVNPVAPERSHPEPVANVVVYPMLNGKGVATISCNPEQLETLLQNHGKPLYLSPPDQSERIRELVETNNTLCTALEEEETKCVELEQQLAEANRKLDIAREALDLFVRSQYPVSRDIDRREYAWSPTYLHTALANAKKALEQIGEK